MHFAILGLTFALLVAAEPAGAQSQERPSAHERAATVKRIEAARSSLRALPSGDQSPLHQARTAPRIVNGDPEVETGQWAWTVSVVVQIDNDKYYCGGSYVAPHVVTSDQGRFVQDWVQRSTQLRWVVTAAHCLYISEKDKLPVEKIKVFGGTLRTDAAVRAEHRVEKYEIHSRYDSDRHTNDIALLRISDPINATAGAGLTMTSIRLPADIDATWLYKPYTALTVHGWGRTSEGGFMSPYLQKVLVPHVDRETCAKAYGSLGGSIGLSMICAGFSSGGFDSCQGDSGGPIGFIPAAGGVINPSNAPILAGVVSWGYGCARQNLYGVYTNLLHMRPWLEGAVARMHP